MPSRDALACASIAPCGASTLAVQDDDKIGRYENTTRLIPAVSDWGVIIMLLLVLPGRKILISHRRAAGETG